MDLLTSPDAWIAFLTLLALEIVLGINNVIFISILSDKGYGFRGAAFDPKLGDAFWDSDYLQLTVCCACLSHDESILTRCARPSGRRGLESLRHLIYPEYVDFRV